MIDFNDEFIAAELALSERATPPNDWQIKPMFIAQQTCEALNFGEYRFPHRMAPDGSCLTYPREVAEANARLMEAARTGYPAALRYIQEGRKPVKPTKDSDCSCCLSCECGRNVARKWKFCPNCGKRLDWY